MIYNVLYVKISLEVRENGQYVKRTKFQLITNTVVLTSTYIKLVILYKTKYLRVITMTNIRLFSCEK